MKKGFTLAELLGVIVLLGALALIVIPLVNSSMKDAEEKMYNNQIEYIKTSLGLWMSENQRPNKGEVITLSLSQLKEAGLVELDLKNPLTKEMFPNDMILKIINNNDVIEYEITTTGTNNIDYNLIPHMKINGNVLDYVEINSENYNDLGVTSSNNNDDVLSNSVVSTDPPLDTSQKGTYLRSYTINSNGYSNTVYRTIIVRDTIAPTIEFTGELTISLSEVDTYDFKQDITVTDNSNEEVTVTVSDNINVLVGRYTVEYQAVDSSGNKTTKLRTVNVTE